MFLRHVLKQYIDGRPRSIRVFMARGPGGTSINDNVLRLVVTHSWRCKVCEDWNQQRLLSFIQVKCSCLVAN